MTTARADGAVRYVGDSHTSLRQAVAAEVRDAILSGRLPPGERLVEEHLAQLMGVSRNPVREALHALAAEGFVVLIPRKGAAVASVSQAEAQDLFDVRMALEELSGRLAARRRDEDTLAALSEVLELGDAAMAADHVDELPALNSRFHSLLAEASGNAMLSAMIHQVRDRMQWVYSTRVDVRAAQSWDEHRHILQAVSEGDEKRAAELAGQHINAARSAYEHPSQTVAAGSDSELV